MITVSLATALALALAAAATPFSVPVVVSPVQRFSHRLNTQDALFHPIASPLDTPIPSWTLKAVPTMVYRPRNLQDLHVTTPWDPIEVLGPDIEDKHTLSQLARMSGNAYAFPGRKKYDTDPAWNIVSRRWLGRVTNLIHFGLRAFLLVGKTLE